MIARERQSGFVLVAALLVLGLAGVVMAAAARRSGALALRANAETRRLQRRWGAAGLQRTLLRRAGAILADAEADARKPAPCLRRELRLGGMTFELLLADEQAKANVNALYRRRGLTRLTATLRSLLRPHLPDVKILPAPTPADEMADHAHRRAFECLGQFVADCDGPTVARLLGGEAPAIGLVTCWGDGRLNFRRCRREALAAVAAGVLDGSQQDRLLALRTASPGLSLAAALKRLTLTKARRTRAAAVLTDKSRCYSLWIVARTPTRRWRRLAVYELAPKQEDAKVRTFVW